MTIVCGTDFSTGAETAARAAAAIAARVAVPLTLVHVSAGTTTGDVVDTLHEKLSAQAELLRRDFDVVVDALVEHGAPDELLVAAASRLGARLLVVSSLGDKKQHRWLLGSVAERVAQASTVAVLVVRDGRIEQWARGVKTLRVVVGVELTSTSKAALDWADGLHAIGGCELTVARIVWPPEHRATSAPMPLDRLAPEIEQALLNEMQVWAGDPLSTKARSWVVKAGMGRVDSHLLQLAEEAEADLLVVGTHQRSGLARFWQGSVSRNVLHVATMNVACVPKAMIDDRAPNAD